MKKNIFFISIIFLIIFCFLHVAFSNDSYSVKNKDAGNTIQPLNSDSITFTTFKTDYGWGYDIYLNDKLYVHQPNIPAVSGNNGFSSAEYAAKTAEFVIEKIRKHILPPTVSVNELDSLNVLK